jgi:hypothetical protein
MPILGNTAGQAGKTSESATITSVTAGSGSVSVAFTEPTYKGKGSVTYTATSSPGGLTATGTSPITVTGLSNGTAYTFTITVTTADGVSTISSASSSATPAIPQAGYVVGGYTYSGATRHATTLKILFSDETVSTLAATLSESRSSSSGYANSGTAGYNTGGYRNTSSYTSIIEKITFSSDALSVLGSRLTVENLNLHATFANSGTAGYTAGGMNSIAGEPVVSTLNKLTFSNDTNSSIGATFYDSDTAQGMSEWSGFANSGTAGYAGGGYNSNYRSRIFKLTFSNDTSSILTSRLSEAKEGLMGAANSGTAGYFAGGYVIYTGQVGTVEKITFSNDSRSVLGSTVATGWRGAGFAKSGTAAYFAGGITGGSSSLNRVNKLTFSNDSISNAANTLTQGRAMPAAFANSGVL